MKSTNRNPLACDLWNEHQAHIAMMQSKEQVARERIAARNAQTILNEQLEKQRKNSEFWHRVMNVLSVIAIAIVIYTLIHFA